MNQFRELLDIANQLAEATMRKGRDGKLIVCAACATCGCGAETTHKETCPVLSLQKLQARINSQECRAMADAWNAYQDAARLYRMKEYGRDPLEPAYLPS